MMERMTAINEAIRNSTIRPDRHKSEDNLQSFERRLSELRRKEADEERARQEYARKRLERAG